MTAVLQQLRIRMENKNFSVNNLEKKAGLKRGVIHNILRGCSKNPTTETLIAIADTLECSLDALVNRSFKSKNFDSSVFALGKIQNIHSENWNSELYLNVVTAIEENLEKNNSFITSEQAIILINEVYHYSLSKNNKLGNKNNEIDQDFIEWITNKLQYYGTVNKII